MILDKEILIRINYTALKHYKEKGYDVKIGDNISVKIEDLTPSSFYEINVKCDVCGSEKLLKYYSYLKNIKETGIYCCSNKCAHKIKNKKTCLEKYGDENYYNIEKYKKTCLEKYGVENVFQNENIKKKIKETNLKKYGFESHNQSDSVKENKKKTFLKKYGVVCYLNTEEQKEKSKKIKLEKYGNLNNHDKLKINFTNKYGVEHPSMIKEFKEKRIKNYKKTIINKILLKYKNNGMVEADFDNDRFVFNCEKGHKYEINRNLLKSRYRSHTLFCTVCNPIGKHISGQEIIFSNFLKEIYDNDIMINTKKIITPNELDVYLPDLKMAFEFNGLFWHNENHREKLYHKEKTDQCEKLGIKLIHIYEDDWIFKQDIVKSEILKIFNKNEKINSINCNIKELKFDDIKDFLNKNSLFEIIDSEINIGLFYNEELIYVMSIEPTNNMSYEIKLLCEKINLSIVNGFDKLFNYFTNKYKPMKVIVNVDRSWSNKDVYENTYFKYVETTKPTYYYVINDIKKLKIEENITSKKEIFKIYNSGFLKYAWNN